MTIILYYTIQNITITITYYGKGIKIMNFTYSSTTNRVQWIIVIYCF